MLKGTQQNMLSRLVDTNTRRGQLLVSLQQLLEITDSELRPVLGRSSALVARALDADKVDVLLYEVSSDCLVAVATNDSPMCWRQRDAGLDRLPLMAGGLAARVFRTGASCRTGRANLESLERQDVVGALGFLSSILCRLQVNGCPRGVLQSASAQADWFSGEDLRFLEAVGRWLGLLMRHAELVGQSDANVVREEHSPASDEACPLTRREKEVATLVADGLTNAEIARRLVLVPGTVSNHVEHILSKLGFARRVQIATWALQQGLFSARTQRTDDRTPSTSRYPAAARRKRGRSSGPQSWARTQPSSIRPRRSR